MRRRAAEAERRERDAALLADLAARLLERGDLSELVARVERSTEPAAVRLEQAVAALVAIAKERERLEREALEAEALRRTDAVKTSVIQSVSHDLRTPLATIETALDGLQSPTIGLDDAQQARAPGLGSTRAPAAQALRREPARPVAAPGGSSGACAGDLDGRRAGGAGARRAPDGGRVRVELPAELPPIRTDAAQVQRALVNVLENALKFSPPDTP